MKGLYGEQVALTSMLERLQGNVENWNSLSQEERERLVDDLVSEVEASMGRRRKEVPIQDHNVDNKTARGYVNLLQVVIVEKGMSELSEEKKEELIKILLRGVNKEEGGKLQDIYKQILISIFSNPTVWEAVPTKSKQRLLGLVYDDPESNGAISDRVFFSVYQSILDLKIKLTEEEDQKLRNAFIKRFRRMTLNRMSLDKN